MVWLNSGEMDKLIIRIHYKLVGINQSSIQSLLYIGFVFPSIEPSELITGKSQVNQSLGMDDITSK